MAVAVRGEVATAAVRGEATEAEATEAAMAVEATAVGWGAVRKEAGSVEVATAVARVG